MRPTITERFWMKVDQSAGDTGCWPWTGCLTKRGYGLFRLDNTARHQVVGSHVYAYMQSVGIPPAAPRPTSIDHTCHNEDADCSGGVTCLHRRCCNPRHLRATTVAENIRAARQTRRTYRTGAELCGTVRGYARHIRHHEPTCDPCRAAINAYHRGLYHRERGRTA